MHLDRDVHRALRRLGREELGHRRRLADRPDTRVVLARRVADEEPRGLDLRCDLGELVTDRLEARERLAEGLTLGRVTDGRVERSLSHPDAEGADARSKRSRVSIATAKPPPTSPRTCSGPAGTPSKSRRPIGCGATSSRCSPVRPSVSRGTANAVMPLAPSSEVRARPSRHPPQARSRSRAWCRSGGSRHRPFPPGAPALPHRARLGLAERERRDDVPAESLGIQWSRSSGFAARRIG